MKFFTVINVQHNTYLKSYKYKQGVFRCVWTDKQSEAIRLNEPQIAKFRNFPTFKIMLDHAVGNSLELVY